MGIREKLTDRPGLNAVANFLGVSRHTVVRWRSRSRREGEAGLLPESRPGRPELNPVEYLWNWCKQKRLCNFVPRDLTEMETAVCGCLDDVRHDQHRLRSF